MMLLTKSSLVAMDSASRHKYTYTPTDKLISERQRFLWKFTWKRREGWTNGHALFFTPMPDHLDRYWDQHIPNLEKHRTDRTMDMILTHPTTAPDMSKPDFQNPYEGVKVYPQRNAKIRNRRLRSVSHLAIMARVKDDQPVIAVNDRYIAHILAEFPRCHFRLFHWRNIIWEDNRMWMVAAYDQNDEIVALINPLRLGKNKGRKSN